MSGVARYFIAQFTPDLMRREAVNVGVFVEKGGRSVARFIGELAPGSGIDKRKVRHLPFADVYEQWVTHWRRVLSSKPIELGRALTATNGGNFSVIPGGEVTDTEEDPPENIADYLFPLLVSEGGLVEALRTASDAAEADAAMEPFRVSVTEAFGDIGILGDETAPLLGVPHPIFKDKVVEGHRPSYVQDNDSLWVMETVDFSTPKKIYARYHAGFAAHMFSQIKARRLETQSIAIIRLRTADLNDANVDYSMRMLDEAKCQVVNWQNAAERQSFLKERTEIARHPW